ncbi:hypothetical protein TD95_002971 [Thielaviopsis punctulata]|uniref:TACO1/YebC-like second and third domain-containing protein n=1 Tax=Thielaviopsis punctulata TaxID=72032 RepID=A0A0F4ZLN0_9PEZI|nr:hypothetical protein TD95_002971 [Thielaviopsis punctulata]
MNFPLSRRLFAAVPQRARFLHSSAACASGHNRWSKIRHEKGAADRKKQAERNVMAKTIAFVSKTGATKTFIENAIARGLGRSPDGAQLESVMIEGMTPGNVALVIEVETDSKGRSLQDLKHELKKHGGKDAGSTRFFFDQLGRLVFARPPGASEQTLDDIVSFAISQDAIDVEIGPEEDAEGEAEAQGGAGPGEVVVWTTPTTAMAIAKAFGEELGLKQQSVDVIWKAKEDMCVAVEKPHVVREIVDLLTALRDYTEVTGVYANGVPGEGISEEEWAKVEDLLDGI